MKAVIPASDTDTLNDAERAFLAGVFAHQGIQCVPTEAEFRVAMAVMSAYAIHAHDAARVGDVSEPAWILRLSEEERLMLSAFTFMEFGVTKPTDDQWQSAHKRLFEKSLVRKH